jgi:uncharacterized short protein YbdD (DUF466 family)
MFKAVKNFWSTIRRLSGDDAYEQYLLHYQQHHADVADSEALPPPLSREEFFKQWQDKKWQGVKRCC